jgi:hypothetical protein
LGRSLIIARSLIFARSLIIAADMRIFNVRYLTIEAL